MAHMAIEACIVDKFAATTWAGTCILNLITELRYRFVSADLMRDHQYHNRGLCQGMTHPERLYQDHRH